MKTIYLLLITILILSCSSPKNNDLKDYMIGSWQTEYIKIEMPTVNKTDSLSIYEDKFQKPKTSKAQSTYKEDGTFTAWFRSSNGSKTGETEGKWSAKNDSIYIDYKYLGKQVKVWYYIQKTPNGFTGKSIYDWDGDGEFDDTFFMETKRITLN